MEPNVGKLRNKILKSIEKQIKEKGLDKHAHYRDLVLDYMTLWDIKLQLIDNIEEFGVSVYWSNGPNQSGHKKNESISELLKVNKQMLTLLNDLGIKASEIKVDDPDAYEL